MIQDYLRDLEAWVRARRTELDELDAAAIAAGRGTEVGSDMALSLSTWKAVSDRYQLIFATWDGGRVLENERMRISTLIWGRLDGASDLPGGLAVSLPEACRLSDALAGQLHTRLSLVPGADASAARIKQIRAQLVRLRDQVLLEPATVRDAAESKLGGLAERLAQITERARSGGDVGGMLGPLENEATTYERDLIVGNAQRRDARDRVIGARELRADLEAREAALEKLAARCVETVDPAPHYAIPDVDALGPVPEHARRDRPLPRAPRPGGPGDDPRPGEVRRRARRAHRAGRPARRLRRQGAQPRPRRRRRPRRRASDRPGRCWPAARRRSRCAASSSRRTRPG